MVSGPWPDFTVSILADSWTAVGRGPYELLKQRAGGVASCATTEDHGV
jgi:hypothetical protein